MTGMVVAPISTNRKDVMTSKRVAKTETCETAGDEGDDVVSTTLSFKMDVAVVWRFGSAVFCEVSLTSTVWRCSASCFSASTLMSVSDETQSTIKRGTWSFMTKVIVLEENGEPFLVRMEEAWKMVAYLLEILLMYIVEYEVGERMRPVGTQKQRWFQFSTQKMARRA